MKRKVLKTLDLPSRGGTTRELFLECGHVIVRPGSWRVPIRADCKVCSLNPTAAASQGSAEKSRETVS